MQAKSRTYVVLAATLAGLLLVPVARAHSVLLETTPASDSVVAESPSHVVLRFDERVDTALGAIRVYDGSARRVVSGAIERPEPRSVAVGIDQKLELGTYTVTWRVISADSDPISGAFVFHVGARGAEPGGVAADVVEQSSGLVSFLYTAVRFLDYCLLLLCAGGALALALVLPTAAPALRRRLYLALAVAAAVLVPVALAGLVLQGAKAGALGLREAVEWDAVSAISGTRFGEMALARAGLAAALALAAIVVSRRAGRRRGGLVCVLLASVILVTPVVSGHASVAGPVAVVADFVHLQAAAVWTGGLAFLLAALLLARRERWTLATRSVPTFSRLAVGAVVLLIAAGVVNGYLQVKTWRGLWDTEYGVLLLAKVSLLLPLLALGAFNNRFAVPKLKAGAASPMERRRFLRTVGAELAVMAVIVGVTSVLVNAAPAHKLEAAHASSADTVELGPFVADLDVTPARAGRNIVRLTFGHGVPPDEVNVTATLEAEEIGPLRYPTRVEAHGVFVARNAELPIPGEWELRIEARQGEFDLYTATVRTRIEVS